MKLPYHTRILIARDGHEPIELVRFKRNILTSDRDFWLRDLSPDWEVIEEHTCRRTVAPRVKLMPYGTARPTIRLSVHERGEIVYAQAS